MKLALGKWNYKIIAGKSRFRTLDRTEQIEKLTEKVKTVDLEIILHLLFWLLIQMLDPTMI